MTHLLFNFLAKLQQWLGLPTPETAAPSHNLRPRGQIVSTLQDLQRTPNGIYLIEPSLGVRGQISLSSSLQNEEARISTENYSVNLYGEGRGQLLYQAISSIETIVSSLFLELTEDVIGQKKEIQIDFIDNSNPDHAGISSGIWSLEEKNVDALVSELMYGILKYAQSESRTTRADSIELSVTIGETVLQGDGSGILPIASFLSEKIYNALKNTGSVLSPLDAEPTHCFFISVYLALIYQHFVDDVNEVQSAAGRKRLRVKLNAELTSPNLLDKTKDYFRRTGIDIDEHEAGSLETVKYLSEKCDCQIQIYASDSHYSRIIMQPEAFRAELPQVHLVRLPNVVMMDGKPNNGKTMYHYVGTRSITSFLSGSRLSICTICGERFSYNYLKSHRCQQQQNVVKKCFSCARTACDFEVFKNSPPGIKSALCPRQPEVDPGEDGEEDCTTTCKKCRTKTQNRLCYNLHQRICEKRNRCHICSRFIYLPKHMSDILTHKNECDRHTFCRNCRTTVEDDPDNKNKRHTCYIPPEIQGHSPPATLISFDLETFPKKGHHWANLATLVYNTRP